MTGGEPVEDVLRAATTLHPDFTPVMFKKWRDGGLIPRPVRRPGRGKTHGTGAIYPDGTTTQLLRLLDIRSEGGRFNMDRALWRLWWEGFDIAPDRIRQMLQDRQRAWADAANAFWSEWEATGREDMLDQLAAARMPLRTLGQMKRHAREHKFTDLIMFSLGMFGGRGAGWFNDVTGAGGEIYDLNLISSALGLQYAFSGFTRNERARFATELGESLERFARAVAPDVLDSALSSATGNALSDARDELKAMIGSVLAFWSLVELVAGKNSAAGDLVRDFQRDSGELGQGGVLIWLSLRSLPGYRQLAALLSNPAAVATLSQIASTGANSEIPPRRRQPSGGSAQGVGSPCTTSLASPPPSPAMVS